MKEVCYDGKKKDWKIKGIYDGNKFKKKWKR
jgi:hypothetical protein